MLDSSPKVADNAPKFSDETSKMGPAVEAHSLIGTIAGPMPAGSQIQTMLAVVARETGIGFRRIKAIWHSEARRIDAEEMDALRTAAARKRRDREARDREEFRNVVAELAAIRRRLAQIDAVMGRAPTDWGSDVADSAGEEDRALAGDR